MKVKSIFFIVLTGLMISCQQNQPTDSPELLKQVVLDYFDGMVSRDFDKMKKVTTDDFMLYEDGQVWNNDSIINFIQLMPDAKIDFSLDNIKIFVDQSSGSMYYFNHAFVDYNDTLKMEFDWIESATFIKAEDGWKMNFMHSTVKK